MTYKEPTFSECFSSTKEQGGPEGQRVKGGGGRWRGLASTDPHFEKSSKVRMQVKLK